MTNLTIQNRPFVQSIKSFVDKQVDHRQKSQTSAFFQSSSAILRNPSIPEFFSLRFVQSTVWKSTVWESTIWRKKANKMKFLTLSFVLNLVVCAVLAQEIIRGNYFQILLLIRRRTNDLLSILLSQFCGFLSSKEPLRCPRWQSDPVWCSRFPLFHETFNSLKTSTVDE